MGKITDRFFNSDYYHAVCRDFEDAKTKYSKGLSAFLQINREHLPKEEYKYQQVIHEKIEQIKEYDHLIEEASGIVARYPQGVKEFRRRNNISPDDNTYYAMAAIYNNKNEILQIDSVFTSFGFLYSEYPQAINLMVGQNPSYENKRYIINNTHEVATIQDYLRYYTKVKNRYPNAVRSFVAGHHDLKTLISFNETTTESSLSSVEEYLIAKQSYTPLEFRQLIGVINEPLPSDYTPQAMATRRVILGLHSSRQREIERQRTIDRVIDIYSYPITIRFGKRPSLLTDSEKDQLPIIQNELAVVQQNYFDVSRDCFWLYEANESFIDVIIRNAESGKKYRLPDDPDDLRMISLFEYSLPRRKTTLRKVFPDLPEMDDFSQEAIAFRKKHLGYFLSTYGNKDIGLSLYLDRSRDMNLRELFRFPGYGEGKQVNFDKSYSIQSAYDLQLELEKYETSFQECFDFVKKNIVAIKEFNKAKTGKETWYIDDLIKIARKDRDLFAFIEKADQVKELRDAVKRLKQAESLGFAEYCKNRYPSFNIDTASTTELQEIVNNSESIRGLQLLEKAKDLIRRYPEAVSEKYGSQSIYSLSLDIAKQICGSEVSLKSRQSIIDEKKEFENRIQRATQNWEQIAGLPYYFFYWYYPIRFTNISEESKRIRNAIYSFKNGSSHSSIAEIVRTKIRDTFTSSDIKSFTFVCIPASTRSANSDRYESFTEDVCDSLGMRNAFPYIQITKEKKPSRLGGEEPAEYAFNRSFFQGSKVILFDDVVTRGGSMRQFRTFLTDLGATVVCALSIGRTYSDYYSDEQKPHPWTGII